ncbi:hypothetical protein OTU49_002360 [Cherax quadricarinatus]
MHREVHQVNNITELYGQCLNFTRIILALLRNTPEHLTLKDLKPQLQALLRDMDLLEFFQKRLAEVGVVSNTYDARALYNVLDLYSALEALRLKYLDKVKQRMRTLSEEMPYTEERDYIHLGSIIHGFTRHINKIRRKATEFLRWWLEPRVDIINTVVLYEIGGLPKLDTFITNLSIPSPFMTLDNATYYLRAADQPSHLLSAQPDDHLWRLVVVNHTLAQLQSPSPNTLFWFKPVPARFGGVRYALVCSSLPEGHHLIIPEVAGIRQMPLYFGPQVGAGAMDVVTLPSGEHVLVHKTKHHAFFLTLRPEDHQVTVTTHYPGRGAHWILSKAREY